LLKKNQCDSSPPLPPPIAEGAQRRSPALSGGGQASSAPGKGRQPLPALGEASSTLARDRQGSPNLGEPRRPRARVDEASLRAGDDSPNTGDGHQPPTRADEPRSRHPHSALAQVPRSGLTGPHGGLAAVAPSGRVVAGPHGGPATVGHPGRGLVGPRLVSIISNSSLVKSSNNFTLFFNNLGF